MDSSFIVFYFATKVDLKHISVLHNSALPALPDPAIEVTDIS